LINMIFDEILKLKKKHLLKSNKAQHIMYKYKYEKQQSNYTVT